MASRLLVSKGVIEFVKAAQIIKDKGLKIKFQLVGEPDIYNPSAISKREINNWVSKGYIEYLGYRDDMHKIIPKSHVVVLPSYYPEGLPKILCEAAACGRAIITTNTPGCQDAVKNGVTGLLINPRDPWRKVVNLLYSCKSIVSASLHGLIVDDAYSIPNIML